MATSVVQKIANAGGVGIPVSLTTSMGATTTEGILLGAANTATAGAQVFSPALHFRGSGWKTDATAGAQSVDWQMEVRPVQGTANPQSVLYFMNSVNGGAYEDVLYLKSQIGGGWSFVYKSSGGTEWTWNDNGSGVLTLAKSTSGILGLNTDGIRTQAGYIFGWVASIAVTTGPDTGLSRISAGVVGVGNGTAGSVAGVISATSHMRVPLTVATLPAGATRGYTCIVTDASNPTFLATVVGGASTVAPVFYDGAAWKVG